MSALQSIQIALVVVVQPYPDGACRSMLMVYGVSVDESIGRVCVSRVSFVWADDVDVDVDVSVGRDVVLGFAGGADDIAASTVRAPTLMSLMLYTVNIPLMLVGMAMACSSLRRGSSVYCHPQLCICWSTLQMDCHQNI